ncbi:MAG: class I SAM-dependent methyltransferase [Acidobacteria bacterium]|nr:class I SAM-dependent methyltransferase [Acidobacteriota bacterium]
MRFMAGLAGWLRLQSVLRLLGTAKRESMLEIGYGEGSFLPELARRARHLAGIDRHGRHASLMAQLADRGIRAELRQANVRAIPYADETFACAVVIDSARVETGRRTVVGCSAGAVPGVSSISSTR